MTQKSAQKSAKKVICVKNAQKSKITQKSYSRKVIVELFFLQPSLIPEYEVWKYFTLTSDQTKHLKLYSKRHKAKVVFFNVNFSYSFALYFSGNFWEIRKIFRINLWRQEMHGWQCRTKLSWISYFPSKKLAPLIIQSLTGKLYQFHWLKFGIFQKKLCDNLLNQKVTLKIQMKYRFLLGRWKTEFENKRKNQFHIPEVFLFQPEHIFRTLINWTRIVS